MSGGLPDWLHEVRRGGEAISVHELTRFAPPADGSPRRGAVLILFSGQTRADARVLLTERAHDMRSHPGQVSFPGGSLEPGEDAVTAALREANEETGLEPSGVDVFGRLPDLYLPPSNFAVTPVLGYWREESPVSAFDPAEVHAVISERVEDLLDPTDRVTVAFNGYRAPGFLIGPERDVLCWGFTAGILSRLFDFVGWSRPWDTSRTVTLPEHMLAGIERQRQRVETQDEGSAPAQWRSDPPGQELPGVDLRDADVDVEE